MRDEDPCFILSHRTHTSILSPFFFSQSVSFQDFAKPTTSYLEEVFEVGLVVGFALQQGGGVELAGAEADVGLHVCELGRQQVSDQLNRHVLSSCLLPDTQGPETQMMMTMMMILRVKHLKEFCYS